MVRHLGFTSDLFYAIRRLRNAPAFSLTAILLLAVGMASNVAVFRLIGALFLRPISVEKPAELVSIASRDNSGHIGGLPSSVLDPLRREPTLRGVCGFSTPRLTTEINGVVASTGTLAMTGDCFRTLALETQLGRSFTLNDDTDHSEKVALLTNSLWHSAFGGRTDVLGQRVKVQGSAFTIIGVTQRNFSGLLLGFPPGLLIPLQQTPLDLMPAVKHKIYFWVSIFARRAAGASKEDVATRIRVLQKQLLELSVPTRYNEAQRRDYFARRLIVSPAATGVDWMLRRRYGEPLYLILGICVSVLLIACINLAGLLLARGLNRQQEVAIRLSLGASRARVARLFVCESLLLVSTGTMLGLLLAAWAVRLVLAETGAMYTDFHLNVSFDRYSALFVAGLILGTALILSAVSLWQAGRLNQAAALRQAGRGIATTGTAAQKILLSFQIALTLALVVSSGLFTSSIQHVYEENLGVGIHGLSESSLAPLAGGYGGSALSPYYRQLLQKIQDLPDVRSASLANFAPFWTMPFQEPVAVIEGAAGQTEIQAQPIRATDQFIRTLGLQLLAGDGFRASEEQSSESVALISEPLARRLGGQRVIGSQIRVGTGEQFQHLKVIGIVSNAQFSLVNPEETEASIVYVNFWQYPTGYPWVFVKTVSGLPISPKILRDAVHSLGREYVERYSTAAVEKDSALVKNRLLAYLSTAFAALGLCLAAVGLFGLLTYHVISRTNEIGVRMALGAERAQIRALVVRQIVRVVLAGIVGGSLVIVAAGPLIRSFVYGIGVYDWRLLSLAILILLLTSMVAAWIPAHRAASIEPLTALRHN